MQMLLDCECHRDAINVKYSESIPIEMILTAIRQKINLRKLGKALVGKQRRVAKQLMAHIWLRGV
jgi:hypothetical protein